MKTKTGNYSNIKINEFAYFKPKKFIHETLSLKVCKFKNKAWVRCLN